jgi:hypothetical protein
MEPPLAYCALLSRMSYLPLETKAVRGHFLPSAAALEDEMWFEVGVLQQCNNSVTTV